MQQVLSLPDAQEKKRAVELLASHLIARRQRQNARMRDSYDAECPVWAGWPCQGAAISWDAPPPRGALLPTPPGNGITPALKRNRNGLFLQGLAGVGASLLAGHFILQRSDVSDHHRAHFKPKKG